MPYVMLLSCLAAATAARSDLPAAATRAEYVVLTARAGEPPPFAAVQFTIGPDEPVKGVPHVWWELSLVGQDADEEPLLTVQALTTRLPFTETVSPLYFSRYLLHIPETAERLEYRDAHTDGALLPPWTRFGTQFVPVAARGARMREGYPQTCNFLGHVLSLRQIDEREWTPFGGTTALTLDPELLVGTARNFKETEDGRLPDAKNQDYTYTPFTAADCELMLEAGMTIFCVNSEQEPFVRAQPVFYLRRPERRMPLRYPADLYRSNFLGTEMFLDEPAIIMAQDAEVNRKLHRLSDATALLAARVTESSRQSQALGRALASRFNLGTLLLESTDYPSWEVHYYTAFYQMEAGLAGFVHEGRYRLDGFDSRIARWTGRERPYTMDEMLRYHYAFLRGGTRPFGKDWGTSIYGQADPAISPRAVTLAHDMGARYIWFWTSDHEFHLPWKEQLELARVLRKHAASHARASIRQAASPSDLAIVIPYGYFLSLDDLTWIRSLDRRGAADGAAGYARVMQRAHQAIDDALMAGADFDITVDDGREITGYSRIIRISDAE